MEDIACMIIIVVVFIGGLAIGLTSNDITELDNGCIVYDNNVYCLDTEATE